MDDVQSIRVPDDFTREFPGSRRASAELAANLVRTTDAFLGEVQRRRQQIAKLSPSAFQALAVLEGAGEPLGARVIADRLLVSSASVTSLLDTLERAGLVERHHDPNDRRRITIHLTDEARPIVDKMLPAVHWTATQATEDLTDAECEQLIELLTRIRGRLNVLAASDPVEPKPRRLRRSRRSKKTT